MIWQVTGSLLVLIMAYIMIVRIIKVSVSIYKIRKEIRIEAKFNGTKALQWEQQNLSKVVSEFNCMVKL